MSSLTSLSLLVQFMLFLLTDALHIQLVQEINLVLVFLLSG